MIDIGAPGLEEGILALMNCPACCQGHVPAEGGAAEHEFRMHRQKFIEVEGRTESAQTGIVHFDSHIPPEAVEGNVIRVEVLADAIEFRLGSPVECLPGHRDWGRSCQRKTRFSGQNTTAGCEPP